MRSKLIVLASALVLAAAPVLATPSAYAQATPMCNGHRATIVGTAGPDNLHGTAGPDVIVGLAGVDVIHGGGGHDVICGGSGRDTLDGGPGRDNVRGQAGDDTLIGGDGNDHLIGNKGDTTTFAGGPGNDVFSSQTSIAEVDYTDAPRGISADLPAHTVTGWGTDTLAFHPITIAVYGSSHDDTMSGTSGPDSLVGGGGTDTLQGGDGDDVLSADAGSLDGGAGSDVLQSTAPGTSATIDLHGGPGADILQTHNPGQVLAGPGDDQVEWDDGIDFPAGLVLDGADGRDELYLPGGRTSPASVDFDMSTGDLSIDGTDVTATGFDLFETYLGGTPSTTYDVTGTGGADFIYLTGDGSSTVHALGGDDQIYTTDGDDVIDGGAGDDTADAGAGTDTCTSVEHPSNCEVVN